MTLAPWASWGVSETGPEHLRLGLSNQDAWALQSLGSSLAVAVSDGLGSCPHAALGAQVACEAVMEAAQFHFRHSVQSFLAMPMLTRTLWGMLLGGYLPEECSATCLLVITAEGAGVFLGLLGDGMIAACMADGTVDLLLPDESEGFANITVGLASVGSAQRWHTLSVPDDRYCAFILCTDGITHDLEPESVRAFAWNVYSHYRQVKEPERQLDVQEWLRQWPVPGHMDDKTIVCVYRREEGDE